MKQRADLIAFSSVKPQRITDDETVDAWHFVLADGTLNRDPSLRAVVGETITETRPLGLCEMGLHASIRPLNALEFAQSGMICRVRLSGTILWGEDKLCASERTVLWMADATTILHEFACVVAEQTLQRERDAGREPDPRSWHAIAAKRGWMKGEVTDDELAAARDAAWAAPWAAARDAAWAAARAAAWAAAWAAARAAARDAAWASAWTAARDAAWTAARAAARAAQNELLESMLLKLTPEVAA